MAKGTPLHSTHVPANPLRSLKDLDRLDIGNRTGRNWLRDAPREGRINVSRLFTLRDLAALKQMGQGVSFALISICLLFQTSCSVFPYPFMTSKKSHPFLTEARLRLNRRVFDLCLEKAEQFLSSQQVEKSMQWCIAAAGMADGIGCNQLVSPELERVLVRIAEGIPAPGLMPSAGTRSDSKSKRWLHVVSEAYSSGGHTALVTRWIENAPVDERHSVVLTLDRSLTVDTLSRAVTESGGTVTALGGLESFVERAKALRNIAWRDADFVVLHVHMFDVIPTVAFGIQGGPTVLFLNHADHTFWVGACVADRVVNIRASGEQFTRAFRGVPRNAQLPIPLPDLPSQPTAIRQNLRKEIRGKLNIPDSAIVLLTIGSGFKYGAIGEIDFLSTLMQVHERAPDMYLVAVGPAVDSPAWVNAGRLTKGHVMALGHKPQAELWGFHAAADIYVEGFPFGSLTALLEAALSGLPCVRAPQCCPPPFVSDGVSLEMVEAPKDLPDYVSKVVELIQDRVKRDRFGTELQRSVREHHCSERWARYLSVVSLGLEGHQIYPSAAGQVPPLEKRMNEFLVQVLHKVSPKYTIFTFLDKVNLAKLYPAFGFKMWKVLFDISREDIGSHSGEQGRMALWIRLGVTSGAKVLLYGFRKCFGRSFRTR